MPSKLKMLAATPVLLLATGAYASPILWIDDAGNRLGTVDVETGNATTIGDTGVGLTDIAFDPAGNLFGIGFNNLYGIDQNDASASLIGPHDIPGGNALVFGADGTLYGAGGSSNNLFTLDSTTADTTIVGDMGTDSNGDLAFNGGDFFLADGSNRLVDIDSLPGDVIGDFGISDSVFGLATGDDGVLYAAAGTNIYSVDTVSGEASFVSSFAGQGLTSANGTSFISEATDAIEPPVENGDDVASVPAPGALLLLATGLVGMSFRTRRC